jgi:hypothetical protein
MGIGVLSSKIAIMFDIDETIDAFRRGTLDFDRSVGPTEERRRALRGPRIHPPVNRRHASVQNIRHSAQC